MDLSCRPDLMALSQAPAAASDDPTPSKQKKKGAAAQPQGAGAGASAGVVEEGQWPCPAGSVQEGVVEVVQGQPAHYAVLSLPQVCACDHCDCLRVGFLVSCGCTHFMPCVLRACVCVYD